MSDDISVINAEDQHRFEIRQGGELVGFADYADADGVRTFPHTEVDAAFEGRGLGSQLIGDALSATIADGLSIRPTCPFVRAYARRGEFAEHVV